MQKKVYNALRSTSVFKRLWFSSITVAIIPMVLISVLLLFVFWNNLNARMSEYAGNLSFQMANYLDLQVQQLNKDIVNFSVAESTSDFLRDYSYMSRKERYLALKQVQTDLSGQFSKLYDISDVILFTNDLRHSIHIYGSAEQTQAASPDTSISILNNLIQRNENTLYETRFSESGSLMIAKRIVNHSSGFIQGYILVRMRDSFLASVYLNLDSHTTTSDVYIINAEGTIMSSSMKQNIGKHFSPDEVARIEGIEGVLSHISGVDRSESYLCAYSCLNAMPATVLCMVPRNYLENDMLSVSLVVLLVSFVLILLASVVSTIIVNSITTPISELIHRMHLVQDNQLQVGDPDLHSDELAAVNNTYNETVLRLRQSIEEIQRFEQEKVNLELRALAAQISPHFITNTLNTIRTLAQIQMSAMWKAWLHRSSIYSARACASIARWFPFMKKSPYSMIISIYKAIAI